MTPRITSSTAISSPAPLAPVTSTSSTAPLDALAAPRAASVNWSENAKCQITKAIAGLDAGWNTKNMNLLMAPMRADVSVIDQFGTKLDYAGLKQLFAGTLAAFPASQRSTAVDNIRLLTKDVAVEDSTVVVTGIIGPDGKEIPTRFHVTSVWTQQEHQWRVSDCRDFVFLPPLPAQATAQP